MGVMKERKSIESAVYSASEIAKRLNISKRMVDRMKHDQSIPGHIKIGRLNRWKRDAVEAWIEAGCQLHAVEN